MEFSESRLADRLVIGAIAHRVSNDDGDAWPSIKRIMHESRLSERQIYDSIKSLCLLGELIVREDPSERGTNRYNLPKFFSWMQSLHPAQNAPPAKSAKCTLHIQQNAPAQNADEPSLELSLNKPSIQSAPSALSDICPVCQKPMPFCPVNGKHTNAAIRKANGGKPSYPSRPNRKDVHVETKRKRTAGEQTEAAIGVLRDPGRLPEDVRRVLAKKY